MHSSHSRWSPPPPPLVEQPSTLAVHLAELVHTVRAEKCLLCAPTSMLPHPTPTPPILHPDYRCTVASMARQAGGPLVWLLSEPPATAPAATPVSTGQHMIELLSCRSDLRLLVASTSVGMQGLAGAGSICRSLLRSLEESGAAAGASGVAIPPRRNVGMGRLSGPGEVANAGPAKRLEAGSFLDVEPDGAEPLLGLREASVFPASAASTTKLGIGGELDILPFFLPERSALEAPAARWVRSMRSGLRLAAFLLEDLPLLGLLSGGGARNLRQARPPRQRATARQTSRRARTIIMRGVWSGGAPPLLIEVVVEVALIPVLAVRDEVRHELPPEARELRHGDLLLARGDEPIDQDFLVAFEGLRVRHGARQKKRLDGNGAGAVELARCARARGENRLAAESTTGGGNPAGDECGAVVEWGAGEWSRLWRILLARPRSLSRAAARGCSSYS